MSFAMEVKAEIGQNLLRECCVRAQLSALIQLCSTIVINNKGMSITIRIENATTAKRIWKLIKETYGASMELSVIKKMRLRKNNIYVIRVTSRAMDILKDLELLSNSGINTHPSYRIIRKDCCARAYLAGAFMASGSVNSPQRTNYHLEISTLEQEHALYIQKLMERFQLPAKYIKRRNQHVIYLKASEKISDFMRCVGAHESVMNFEDLRIQRDFKNSLTRLDNCEVANEMKTLKAGASQLEDIELLESHGRMAYLDDRLKDAANLRKQYPEASLNDLCEKHALATGVKISKSGMKHRLAKLKELADRIRTEK